MKDTDRPITEIEQQLRRARLAGPSEELKARVLDTARETWKNAPAEMPWRVPLRRFGLSAVAALLIVSSANYVSALMVAPWQAGRPAVARVVATDAEDMPEMLYSPFVQHVLATCGTPAQDGAALLDYLQKVHETLDGAEQDDAAEGSGPAGRESRLSPVGAKIKRYV